MPDLKPILIASDHAGIELKAAIQKRLSDWKWLDLGPQDAARVDYPDYAQKVSERISSGQAERGILICGSGIGMCIAANKFPKIRAALVENLSAAKLAREHNDANILCLGARYLAPEYATEIALIWLTTPFSGEARHAGRIEKISALEFKNSNHGGHTS